MCTVPSQIQAQFSEAISLIATVDFPTKWDNLLNDLIQKFNSPDPNIVSGVLLTANSILKRFRYQVKSDALFGDILYVLERLQAPLLTLFKTIGAAIDSYANDEAQLKPRMASLRSICRIFFSLNWQDLPEYFEDHMSEWMTGFAKFLKYTNPKLVDDDEEDEASPIDNLQAAIIDNLYLYADKDEEPFIPFLGDFTSIVWNLLIQTSKLPKHDVLATTCIKFLSSLVGKPMHKALFQGKETLQQIISNIVIPNLHIRQVDEEQFEDDPAEFIQSDMEESDSESRRKRSQDLLRAMCRQFEEETTSICMECINKMLTEFSSSNGQKWASKDAAVSNRIVYCILYHIGLYCIISDCIISYRIVSSINTC
jgi:exportin-2 (importin alpha re-exporter)